MKSALLLLSLVMLAVSVQSFPQPGFWSGLTSIFGGKDDSDDNFSETTVPETTVTETTVTETTVTEAPVTEASASDGSGFISAGVSVGTRAAASGSSAIQNGYNGVNSQISNGFNAAASGTDEAIGAFGGSVRGGATRSGGQGH